MVLQNDTSSMQRSADYYYLCNQNKAVGDGRHLVYEHASDQIT